MKIDVRERNTSVKDDFREKIQLTEKIVQASEKNILGIVRSFKDDMHSKFDKVTGMTEYHDNKIGDLKQEVADLRGDFMNSIMGISDTVKAVANEVTRVGDKIENRLKQTQQEELKMGHTEFKPRGDQRNASITDSIVASQDGRISVDR